MTATMQPAASDLRLAKRWIPKESTEVRHALGVCYTQETERAFLVIAYAGTASKRAFYESHRTREARDKRVAEFFAGLESHAAMMTQHKAERSAPHTLKLGDILHHSWGWEQTNCDYYQVVAVTAHGATIREIASETVPGSCYSHGMADMRNAVKDAFCGDPIKVQIDGTNHVRPMKRGPLSHGSASVWDGKPNYCSWYA